MLGLIQYGEERGITVERTRLQGLAVLRVRLLPGGRWERKRIDRAARLLKRQGIRRVLVPKGFSCWEVLVRRGLCAIDPLPLYRAMADRLVLAELARRGVEERVACVALRGEYVDRDLAGVARLLCPRVRTILIQVRQGGEKLTRELYREFGVGTAARARPDVAVRFGGDGEEGELVLCGRPDFLGLELDAPERVLPEETEPLPLLTALWQAGGLDLGEIRVFDNKCS